MATDNGQIIFGYCLDIFLYGILTVQMYLYYLAFPQDRRMTKSIVYFVYIVETLQTALALHDFYTLFCTLQGRRHLESLDFDVFAFSFMWFTIPASGALVAFAVQLFYAHRIYVISKDRVITAIVVALASLQSICGIIVTICTFGPLRSEDSLSGGVSLPIGSVSGALCDLLIAIYMSCYLSRKMKGTSKTTQALVTKIGLLLLETGILTAIVAVVYAILAFFTDYGLTIPGLCLSKLYANSMLVLLNNRFTISGGRNVPHPNFGTSSYRRSDLVDVRSSGVS